VTIRTGFLLPCALAAAVLAACHAKPTPPEGERPGAVKAPPDQSFGEKPPAAGAAQSAAASAPTGVDWLLTSIEGKPVKIGPPGAMAALRLDSKTGEAVGRAVCNQFHGHFDLDEAGLRFGPLATTRMACQGPAQDEETRYLKGLQETSRWSRDGDRLVLSNAAGKTLLEFSARAQD
jgi:heat shock protein HslJ